MIKLLQNPSDFAEVFYVHAKNRYAHTDFNFLLYFCDTISNTGDIAIKEERENKEDVWNVVGFDACVVDSCRNSVLETANVDIKRKYSTYGRYLGYCLQQSAEL